MPEARQQVCWLSKTVTFPGRRLDLRMTLPQGHRKDLQAAAKRLCQVLPAPGWRRAGGQEVSLLQIEEQVTAGVTAVNILTVERKVC